MEGEAALAQGRKPSSVPRLHQLHKKKKKKKVHRRSRPSNLRKAGAEPEQVSHRRTRSGKPQVPQDQRHNSHTKRGSGGAYPTPSRRRGRRQSSAAQKKRNPTHINRDHQRWGPQPKHKRLAIVGEREAENRQTEQKGYTIRVAKE